MKRLIFIVALAPCLAAAQVPGAMAYQGRLLKSDGTPETGVVTLQFNLYAAPSGGNPLWSETQLVALTQGYYATLIGSASDGGLSPALFDGSERYLELSVNGSPLAPRHRLGATPYAFRAGSSTSVSGGSVNASSVSINGSTVIDSSGKWVGTSGAVTAVSATAPLVSTGTTAPSLAIGSCPTAGQVVNYIIRF